jgi:hypothetical protein
MDAVKLIPREKCPEPPPATKTSFELIKELYVSLSVELVAMETAPNQLNEVLVVCRKIRSYSESSGPFEPIKLVIVDDLSYTVYVLCVQIMSLWLVAIRGTFLLG